MDKDSIILVLSCLGLVQALFLSIYLFTLKKGNKKGNVFLSLLILGLTIRIGKSVLNVYLDISPWMRNIGISGILLVGPMLWFYGKSLFQEKSSFSRINYYHLGPFFVFFCASPFIPNTADFISYVIYISVFIHLAYYLVLSFKLLMRFSSSSNSKLVGWYRNLIVGTSLIWSFYIGHLAGIIPFYIGGAIFFSLLVYVFSFLLLRKHTFSLLKYQDSQLDVATASSLIRSIKKLFKDEELFLESSLTLDKVAEKLKVSPRNLSQALNENEGKNFSEFVNSFRIEKAKKLLVSQPYSKEKIATVAYDCGFGNVTSFNITFKSATKQTPSSYRKAFS
ncbi:helix-turn-helix domain-containing protein [Croceitalea rosinachiae]|uniref:Helix-turn-helix transcriptional regulator n=1 Tax=Croceitalea rosinachiae TaxID=3075596 RepID=A0ABU3A7G1_9FLAO|nr:helix-turn-helix transcriptional regulator [Croceitalea sp. F388]MDT0606116.1 helix-turn-helix transcriptional regulator [Croceitalea sp. F388]